MPRCGRSNTHDHPAALLSAGALAAPADCRRVVWPAGPPTASPPELASTRSMPRSSLSSPSGVEVREGSVGDPPRMGTLLVAVRGSRLVPLVTVSGPGERGARVIFSHALAEYNERERALLRLAASESLYPWLMRQSPLDTFELAGAERRRRAGGSLTHAMVLGFVARLRECGAAEAKAQSPELQVKPWRTARITAGRPAAKDSLRVSALVLGPAREPLQGQITFGRGVHLACAATLDAAGFGECDLFDSHGHDLHDHDHHGPTTVTYSGLVAHDHIVPPTTMVLAGKRSR